MSTDGNTSDLDDGELSMGATYDCTKVDDGPALKTKSADDGAPADENPASDGCDAPPAGADFVVVGDVTSGTAGDASDPRTSPPGDVVTDPGIIEKIENGAVDASKPSASDTIETEPEQHALSSRKDEITSSDQTTKESSNIDAIASALIGLGVMENEAVNASKPPTAATSKTEPEYHALSSPREETTFSDLPTEKLYNIDAIENRFDDAPKSTATSNPTGESHEQPAPSSPKLPSKEESITNGEDLIPPDDKSVDPSLRHHSSTVINVALESLESMRRLNLEVEISNATSAFPVFHDKCTYCQREALQNFLARPPLSVGEGQQRGINIGRARFDGSRIRNLHKSLTEPRQQPVAGTTNGVGQEEQRGISVRKVKLSEALHMRPTNLPPPAREDQQRGINKGSAQLDGSRIRSLQKSPTGPRQQPAAGKVNEGGQARQHSINKGKVKLDGSRVRRFRSNVRGFFAKPTANEGDDSSKAAEVTSLSEETPSSNNGTAANNRAGTSRRNILKKAPRPCLTCGHPTCSKHSSSIFSKNHITLCQSCAYLFELDFLVDVITSTASNYKECQQKVNEMIDCYDRAKLLLVYTAQYTDEIASALETHTVRSNKIGAGSSATGVVSGITGVVGCGALLFPPVAVAGVPLLIASLVFGGGATALQSGDAAANYFSEPNRLAEKMVALHGMVLSLLRITEVLSYGLLKSHLGVNYSVEGFSENDEECKDEEEYRREAFRKEINELLEKHGVATTKAAVGGLQSAVASGLVATRVAAASTRMVATEATAAGAVGAVAGTEAAISASSVASGASMVGRGTRYIGRVGTTASAGVRFIPIAGGLLSAACVYVEGRELKRTLDRIGEGNPCAKAEQVRSIRDELDMLPDSSLIAAECRRVFELAKREKSKKAEQVDDDIDAKEGPKKVGDVALEDLSQADISDLIDVMESTARADGMEEKSEPGV